MSILINGMDMPNEGAERCIVIRGDGTIRTFTGALIDYATAVPVPPHGRLIDADALYPIYANLLDGGDVKAVVPKSVIDTSPTIIPAEEDTP